jgi:glycosyltransferase involved in cell wall biosynthesis
MFSNNHRTPLNLLLIGNFIATQGGNRSVGEELAEYLSLAGHSVITSSDQRSRLSRLFDMVRTIWYRRREYQAAYVEVYSGPAFVWAEVVCWLLTRLRKPFILTLHGGNLPVFAERYPARVRRLLMSADVVTVPSSYLHAKMGKYRNDLFLLPNPINCSHYHYNVRKHVRPILVWLRAFHTIYNPTLAPRVLSHLVSKWTDISLTMIGPDRGDGSLKATQEFALELGLESYISFSGSVPKRQVPDRLDAADIFINTTTIDNTPVSILEAMASGLCIVSTDVGGIPFLLDDKNDALLVPSDDPEAMASAVNRILSEPELACRLSENARKKVEQFDWSKILHQWESLFDELVRND